MVKTLVWARVVMATVLTATAGVAFGYAWTTNEWSWWLVGAMTLLAAILIVLSLLHARTRPPAPAAAVAGPEPLVPLLGALLLYKYRAITHEQLNRAVQRQRKDKRHLGEILVGMGLVTQSLLDEALEYQRSLARHE